MTRFPPLPARSNARALLAAALLCLAVGTKADELSDVERLYRAGQTDAAMARTDKFLSAKPTDPQMRFMKGVMLAEAGRNAEAASVFSKLTEDHPDLVEPYNNLAAIYAATGDYPKARSTLEQALRANPGYATAHENLGDVYVAMAGQSYARALQLAPNNPGIGPKLTLVRQLLQPKGAPQTKLNADALIGATGAASAVAR